MNIHPFDFNIPLKNIIIITAKKKKTGKQFWKDVEVGDRIELTYLVQKFGNKNAPVIELLKNGSIEHDSTSTVVADTLYDCFEFEWAQ